MSRLTQQKPIGPPPDLVFLWDRPNSLVDVYAFVLEIIRFQCSVLTSGKLEPLNFWTQTVRIFWAVKNELVMLLLVAGIVLLGAHATVADPKSMRSGVWVSPSGYGVSGPFVYMTKAGQLAYFSVSGLPPPYNQGGCSGVIDFRDLKGDAKSVPAFSLFGEQDHTHESCPKSFKFLFANKGSLERKRVTVAAEGIVATSWVERVAGPPGDLSGIELPQGVDILGIKPGMTRARAEATLKEKLGFVPIAEAPGIAGWRLEEIVAAGEDDALKFAQTPFFSLIAYAESQHRFGYREQWDSAKFMSVVIAYHKDQVVTLSRRLSYDPDGADALNLALNKKYDVDALGQARARALGFVDKDFRTVSLYFGPQGRAMDLSESAGDFVIRVDPKSPAPSSDCATRVQPMRLDALFNRDEPPPGLEIAAVSGCGAQVRITSQGSKPIVQISISDGARYDAAVWPDYIAVTEQFLRERLEKSQEAGEEPKTPDL